MTQADIDACYRAWYRQTWPNHILAAPYPYYGSQLLEMITREAVRLFRNSNYSLREIGAEFDEEFVKAGEKIGSRLRIRLPSDYLTPVKPVIS